jgi:hypothetical protein
MGNEIEGRPERLLPAKPGKWYVRVNDGPVEIMRVIGEGGQSVIDSGGTPRPIEWWRGLRFIAPIPGPTVCAALAEYAAALAAFDATYTDGVHAFEGAGLDDGLRVAIRAERAATGGDV